MSLSVPLHWTLSNQMRPAPKPYTFFVFVPMFLTVLQAVTIVQKQANCFQLTHSQKCDSCSPSTRIRRELKQCFFPRCMECQRGLAMRKVSVCPAVRLSNAWIVTKWNKDLSRFLKYTKEHLAIVFWETECLVAATTSTWNFGPIGPDLSEIADFQPIFARSASAVTPSEKVQ